MSEVLTFIIYVFSLAFLGSIINTSQFDPIFIGKVVTITLVAWLPFVILEIFYHRFFPTMLDKLKVEAKAKSKTQKKEQEMSQKESIRLYQNTLERRRSSTSSTSSYMDDSQNSLPTS